MKKSFALCASLLATALIGIPSVNALAAPKAPASSPALIEKGKQSYTTNCLTCHGEKGDGKGPAGQYLTPPPRHFGKDKFKKGNKPEQIFESITKGLPGTSMVGFAHIPEDERWGLVYYVLELSKAGK